jgi:hypothetical protein
VVVVYTNEVVTPGLVVVVRLVTVVLAGRVAVFVIVLTVVVMV